MYIYISQAKLKATNQNPADRSATKRKLSYWTDLAKLLERGGFNALFLADTYGGYDTYEGKLDECIRRGAQWPVTDPTIVCFLLTILSVVFQKDTQGNGREEVNKRLAHFRHGSRDEEPRLWHHSVDVLRAAVLTGKTLLNTRPSNRRAHWMEHRHIVEESRVQGDRVGLTD